MRNSPQLSKRQQVIEYARSHPVVRPSDLAALDLPADYLYQLAQDASTGPHRPGPIPMAGIPGGASSIPDRGSKTGPPLGGGLAVSGWPSMNSPHKTPTRSGWR